MAKLEGNRKPRTKFVNLWRKEEPALEIYWMSCVLFIWNSHAEWWRWTTFRPNSLKLNISRQAIWLWKFFAPQILIFEKLSLKYSPWYMKMRTWKLEKVKPLSGLIIGWEVIFWLNQVLLLHTLNWKFEIVGIFINGMRLILLLW